MSGEQLTAVDTAEETGRGDGDTPAQTAAALRRENAELRDRLAEQARERRRIVDHYERLLDASRDRSEAAGTAVEWELATDAVGVDRAGQNRRIERETDADGNAGSSRQTRSSRVWTVLKRIVRRLR